MKVRIKIQVDETRLIDAEYVVLVTTAPQEYDYGYVRQMDALPADRAGYYYGPGMKHAVRLIMMPEEHVEYQCGRYSSGMYVAFDPVGDPHFPMQLPDSAEQWVHRKILEFTGIQKNEETV